MEQNLTNNEVLTEELEQAEMVEEAVVCEEGKKSNVGKTIAGVGIGAAIVAGVSYGIKKYKEHKNNTEPKPTKEKMSKQDKKMARIQKQRAKLDAKEAELIALANASEKVEANEETK